jgi:NAD+ synthase
MIALYHEAAIRNYLVCGTSDKSELMIGYFTKYGDGASDLMPLAGLYKTEVRELGRYLDIPKTILNKKSSPRLWKGHLAETELGITYEVIDPILQMLQEKKNASVLEISKSLRQSSDTVSKIKSMVESSAHKRLMPAIPPDFS